MSNVEDILQATIDGTEYSNTPQSRVESLLLELKETIESSSGGGGGSSSGFISDQYTTLSSFSGTAAEDGFLRVEYTNAASNAQIIKLRVNDVIVWKAQIPGQYADNFTVTFPIKAGQRWSALDYPGAVTATAYLHKMV